MFHEPDIGTVADWCVLFKSAQTWDQLRFHFEQFHKYQRPFIELKETGKLYVDLAVPLIQEWLNSPDGIEDRQRRLDEHKRLQFLANERTYKGLAKQGFVEVSRVIERGIN